MNSARQADLCSKFLPFFLGLIVLLAYGRILPTFFVQDDFWFLKDTLRPFPNLLMVTGGLPEYLRPVSTYWFPLLNKYLWGVNSFGFHFSQMVCLLLTVYALFRIVLRLTRSATAASVAALVYGLSKIHLSTLGWLAGGIDNVAGCLMALTLLAIIRYEQGEGALWPIGVACLLALLSKESTVILIAAWLGATVVRAILVKFLPPQATPEPAAGNGGRWTVDGGRKENSPSTVHQPPNTARPAPRPAEQVPHPLPARRELWIGLLLLGIVIAYAILRMSLVANKSTWGLDLARFGYVIRSSILAILPIAEPTQPIAKLWILLPLAIIAGAVLLRPWHAAHEAVLGFLLWVLHAAIFAVSINLPSGLQLYYAHFNVIGLALLCGLFCAGVLRQVKPGWTARAVHATILALLALYGYQSFVVVRQGIEHANAPALFEARYSEQAYTQLRCFMTGAAPNTIVFLNVSELMWWSMGKGDLVPVMFPGVQAKFDGRDGFQAPPEAKTDATTLVVRQTSEFGFAVVK